PARAGRPATARDLQEDLDRELRLAAALEQVDRLVQIDLAARRELRGGLALVAGFHERLAPPALDPVALGLLVDFGLYRSHLRSLCSTVHLMFGVEPGPDLPKQGEPPGHTAFRGRSGRSRAPARGSACPRRAASGRRAPRAAYCPRGAAGSRTR